VVRGLSRLEDELIPVVDVARPEIEQQITNEDHVDNAINDPEGQALAREVPEAAEAQRERLDDGYVREHDRDKYVPAQSERALRREHARIRGARRLCGNQNFTARCRFLTARRSQHGRVVAEK
jgi:hypothetical protein